MSKETEELKGKIEAIIFDARQEVDNPRDDSWQRTAAKYADQILQAFKEAGGVFLDLDQNLPKNPLTEWSLASNDLYETTMRQVLHLKSDGYKRGQQDMLRANFKRIKEIENDNAN